MDSEIHMIDKGLNKVDSLYVSSFCVLSLGTYDCF
nr:MAG TPA: hypothetical protein [Caudoviricetes sp.]